MVALVVLLACAAQGQSAMTAEARDDAIRKGFDFLDERLWRMQDGGSPQKQYSIAITAWASLLAADHEGDVKKLPSRTKELERLRKYLERYVGTVANEYGKSDEKARKRGKPADAGAKGDGGGDGLDGLDFGDLSKPLQYVWPVSMAAHYFAECFARGRDKADAKQGLKDAIAVLEAAQQKNGGWGHDDAARPGMGLPPIKIPKPGGGSEIYPATLLAASNCALSALGVAHARLGTKTPASLAKGIQYFLTAQNENGTFPYDPTQRHTLTGDTSAMAGGLEVARTPAAFFALCCAGARLTGNEVRSAVRAMDDHPESWSEGHGSATMALQFAALASRARGDSAWSLFRRLYLPRILAHQEQNGGFTCIAEAKQPGVTSDTEPLGDLPGMDDWIEQQKVYVTSIHVLILLLDRSRPGAIPPIVLPAETVPEPASGK